MDDLISRQDAIKAISEAFSTGDADADRYTAERVLAEAPSAQPEILACRSGELVTQPEIIRCKDCVLTDGYGPIADGRYWCMLHGAYMHYCSDAERRTDE